MQENPRWQLLSKPITQPLCGKVRGLGEVYEMMSCENKRKKLVKKYPNALILLYPMPENMTIWLGAVTVAMLEHNLRMLDRGYIDTPPWESKPKENGTAPSRFKILAYKPLFKLLVKLEWLTIKKYKPHMYYIVFEKKSG